MKKILITGAKGFIGSNVCKYFKNQGYITYGIGHGDLSIKRSQQIGLDFWQQGDISISAILAFNQVFDVIVHCGGSGSVGFSVENPYQDFKKTVDGTLEVLEYMRLYNQKAHLIYPSSPAVQGECANEPINEEYIGKPASPYGYHKKIAEDLCQSYSEKYNLVISVVRLFSVYGKGLKKQLLWDAAQKIQSAEEEALFWGTGNETRDFIHIDDAIALFEKVLKKNKNFLIINGGAGIKLSIKHVIENIRDIIKPSINIKFNNQINEGNPIYYWSDIKKQHEYGFEVKVSFAGGLKEFITWTKNEND
ncbi:NAD-dependent epimerase/dehydratase family protein [Francisella adeliensis]|uniref:Epimerase n=1 Tax=Francisella adeliensis TaxID=2007306 RepID=A0A2Z4XXU1_9GAMM|nr:NAD(P)-dependent oxidoreductase [Francisella adeliensis]AXA33701.1 epimerase [Francisella adeliensis]MBK2085595.1 NAD(P)-dependent oxidoreductase [Francisella adeliensis]MBK2097473.1 NAD(P)-dependent oxidoreductase [Francisella adeliensis]QIW11935.1 NAD(P)-dependent oxidoreductase [Francisella adeliensis]QIW13811.1 NAD(P)-dependent oxidoreductase [Francisella adeliensis]